MEWTVFAAPAVSVALAVAGSYAAMRNANNDKFSELMAQNAAQTAEIRALKEQVEKHNGVLERVFKLESDMGTAFKRLDELRASGEKLADRMNEGR